MQFRLKSLTSVALLAVAGFGCGVATAEAASQPAVGSTVVDAAGKTVGTVVDADTLAMKIGSRKVLFKASRHNIYGFYSFNSANFGVELNYTQANCKGTAYFGNYKLLQYGGVVLDKFSDTTKGTIYYADTLKITQMKSYKLAGTTYDDDGTCYNGSFTVYAGPAKTLKYSFKPPFNVK